jgi:RNA polymerase sigma-70 factor, ECF subfamily
MIINRCRTGDSSAFREIMEMHYNYTYAVAFKILHSEADAEDIIQEAFVRVWRNISNYQPEKKFTTWLYRIVVNLCYDQLKKESRQRENLTDFSQLPEEERVSIPTCTEKDIEMKDMGSKIIEFAKTLPPKQRLVFSLRDLNDISLEEISQTTGMSMSSVKTNLSYARRYLRRKIEELEQ